MLPAGQRYPLRRADQQYRFFEVCQLLLQQGNLRPRSAGFAVAFCASPEMDIICSRASARLLTAGSIASTCP